jgi:glucose-1-phosphate thymidylyltransferase
VDVILPVAGLGSRLRPQTWSRPKPLLGLAGKPILAHVIDEVMPLDPEKLVFITGYLGDQVEAWARATYDLPLAFVEQPEMRGQTDAILRVRAHAAKDALILFPDMVFAAEFSRIGETDSDVVIFTKDVDDPSAFGVAVEEAGRVVKLVEKPQEPISRKALVGIYYVRSMPDLYSAIEEQMERGIMLKNEYFLADAVQIMIERGAKVTTAPVTVWEDCGSVANLLSTNRFVLDRDQPAAARHPNSVVVEPSFVHPTATLERAVVGPYASIGAGVTVRDSVLRDVIVEDGATIEGVVAEQSLVGVKAQVSGRAAMLNVGDTSGVTL